VNRRERRAWSALGKGQAFGGKIDATGKAALVEMINRPEVLALIRALAAALEEWRGNNPRAELRWQKLGRTMVTGDLANREAQSYLAASPAAFAALDYASEKTGNQATVMLAEFALVALDWVEPRE
jgi:hypothetical protein